MRWLVLLLLPLACAEHHVVGRTFDAEALDASGRDTGSREDSGPPDGGGFLDTGVCSLERPMPFRISEAEAECLGLASADCAVCHRHPRDGFSIFPDAPPPPMGIEPFEPEELRGCLCEAAACDLSRVVCTGLPGCLGESPPETMYCDDVRICLQGAGSDRDAAAIASFARRIECRRADSCDYLCGVTDGDFDDEVRAELCAIAAAAPDAQIECAIFGP